ncbi:unnamed protein product [Paramecium sonneborni]|uniref:Uncharacterized protein n=1 Tax=Paramecium sonneborni TaxID=65129 RepID=A0A8S1N5P6_9CILI|nr:unnamed protein product [Paramecium sonneborni]
MNIYKKMMENLSMQKSFQITKLQYTLQQEQKWMTITGNSKLLEGHYRNLLFYLIPQKLDLHDFELKKIDDFYFYFQLYTMGNNSSQHKSHPKPKIKKKEQFKKFFAIKKDILFSKLSQKTASLITSFLNIQEFNNLLQASKVTFEIFNQTSGCFQIECQRLLNVKCELIQSKNWKFILQSVMCIPIRTLPYGEAIKSVRLNIKQFPIFIEQKINYSGFQKAILYYENQLNEQKKVIKSFDYQQALQFASNNTDIILRLRQGLEIHTQLPDLLMLIYNLQDYIKIFCQYLEIRFSKCNLEQFIQMWQHYQGWISSVENQTFDLIYQFNRIIDESLPQFKLPKYTIRHFMVCEWLKKADKGEIIVKLRENFRLKMIECRNQNQKSQFLKQYVQYLIDISTNQNNITKYGYYNFQYCQELNQLITLTIDLTPKLNIEYQQDEDLLIFIFGQYVYNYYIFEMLSSFRVEQFKHQIKQFHQESQQMSKILVKNFEDQHNQNSIFGNENSNFKYHLSIQYNVQLKIRSLFKQVSLMDEDISNSSDNIVAESIGTSGISLTSTNCSSVFSSVKNNDQLYHYIKTYQKELFNKIQRFYCKEQEVYQYSQEQEQGSEAIYDVPELAQYEHLQYQNLIDQILNRTKRSNAIYQLERRQTILTSYYHDDHQQIQTQTLNLAEQLIKQVFN